VTIKRLTTRPIYLTKEECEFVQSAIDTLSSVMVPSASGADSHVVKFSKLVTAARLRSLRILFDCPKREEGK
jgi:hypothetical protein